MMTKAKYIVIMNHSTESVIIFPEWVYHKTMAGENKVISAGFVQFLVGSEKAVIEVRCFGNSTSLNVESRGKEDEQIIQTQILT